MELSHFTVKGTWEGDRNGVGKIQSSSGITIEASVPREFDGRAWDLILRNCLLPQQIIAI
ncbi:hypothetical protein RCG23_00960 [Neobacillus sp. PS3-34]|uniref:hypothetical protein n=1 Tax=Neobacillus sp. PS3-34 TaxID=3070678 RepID=UPI0027DFA4BA|nr:hypothetical protein [Neobacillus sp. PS3-34]WML48746.1 hypothetical protein RCG23_00960 [Neobacillus sp. PS3-34]